jgi:hypothetical protein
MSSGITISKSAFIKGLQCYKSLYLKKHHPHLEDKVSDSLKSIFNKGTNIGLLAQNLFPGGTDLGIYIPDNFPQVFTLTNTLLQQDASVIYEADFSSDKLMCFTDILTKKNKKYLAYEVKGSTSVSDVYLWDTAFQYHVISLAGIQLHDIFVVYINNQYVRNGELDINQLFIIESVKDRILPLLPKVKAHISQMKSMLSNQAIPDINIGPHCTNPYSCSFMGHCWKHIPEYSVFNISRLSSEKKFKLYNNNIINISDVPDDFPLSANQQLQVICEKTGQSTINKPEISAFTNRLQYPLYFLDFETFQSAIPMFDQSKPFQQITFQYSLHIQEKPNGELIHKEFLAQAVSDPRTALLKQLVNDIGLVGHILVYNQGFEIARLNEMANDFPIYQFDIKNIVNRIIDLMIPFSQKHYYTPQMKGSYSIKKVLPALVPNLSYKGLNIAQGGDASLAFESLYTETDQSKIDQTRKDLLTYCGLDTLAMVKILETLNLT